MVRRQISVYRERATEFPADGQADDDAIARESTTRLVRNYNRIQTIFSFAKRS